MALQHVSWPWPPLISYSNHSCFAAVLHFFVLSSFAASLHTLSPHLFHGILLVLPRDFLPEFVLGFITTCTLMCVTRLVSMHSLHFYTLFSIPFSKHDELVLVEYSWKDFSHKQMIIRVVYWESICFSSPYTIRHSNTRNKCQLCNQVNKLSCFWKNTYHSGIKIFSRLSCRPTSFINENSQFKTALI